MIKYVISKIHSGAPYDHDSYETLKVFYDEKEAIEAYVEGQIGDTLEQYNGSTLTTHPIAFYDYSKPMGWKWVAIESYLNKK